MTDVDANDAVADAAPPSQPRRWGMIAAVAAGVLVVALGVTAAVVVPRVLHSQRVEEYTELADQLRAIVNDRAEVETTLHAATVLTHVHHGEAMSVAHAVAALGESSEPMLPAEQAQLLGETGVSAADELGTLDIGDAPSDGADQVLTLAYIEAKAAEEQARAEAEEAGDEVPEPELAASLADLDVDQAIWLLASPVAPDEVTTVADEDVTDELIEQMRESIATVQDDISVAHHDILIQDQRQEFVSETVAAMLPVLQETAAAIDDYLAAVEEHAAKAEEEIAATTSSAAANVRDSASGQDVVQIQGFIATYVVAGEASLESHAAVVKAEAEAEAKRKAEEEAKRKAEAAKKSSSGSSGGKMCQRFSPALFGTGGVWTMVPCR